MDDDTALAGPSALYANGKMGPEEMAAISKPRRAAPRPMPW